MTSIIYLALKHYLGMQCVCNKKTCVNVTDIVSFYLKPKLLSFSFSRFNVLHFASAKHQKELTQDLFQETRSGAELCSLRESPGLLDDFKIETETVLTVKSK